MPFTHNGVGYGQFRLIGIPASTAGRKKVIFAVMLEYGRGFPTFSNEIAGVPSGGPQIIVCEFTDIKRFIISDE